MKMTLKQLIDFRNMAQCKRCLDIIESKSRHDYVTCSCGNLSVDGGTEYLKRGCGEYGYIELSGNSSALHREEQAERDLIDCINEIGKA